MSFLQKNKWGIYLYMFLVILIPHYVCVCRCCRSCVDQLRGCCCLKCTSAPRLRPALPGHQRYRKWHHYRDAQFKNNWISWYSRSPFLILFHSRRIRSHVKHCYFLAVLLVLSLSRGSFYKMCYFHVWNFGGSFVIRVSWLVSSTLFGGLCWFRNTYQLASKKWKCSLFLFNWWS